MEAVDSQRAAPRPMLYTARMSAAPSPGARVQIAWSDGRVYPATVCAVAQNLAEVRWDAGGATAWVPLASIAAIVSAPSHVSTPPGPAQPVVHTPTVPPVAIPAAAPAAAVWDAYAAYARPQTAQSAREVAPAARPAPVGKTPASKSVASAALPGLDGVVAPPPRPMSTIEGLPRGLVYEPTAHGPGTGQVFFVFFGFLATADVDVAMRLTDIEHLGDDVAAMRAAGLRVVVDLHGDLGGLNHALAGTHPEAAGLVTTGVFWGGHGSADGSIHTFDGGLIEPEQIAPHRGSVKLFVMSACHAGSHTARWQKSLGPQALVIGWGAPITNERAIEFLTPDDSSSKGFDDLLERQLGVRRVAADGPLAEVRDLARLHEDRVALLMLPFDELLTRVQSRLKCQFDRGRDGAGYFTVRTPPSKSAPTVGRAQSVRVGPMGVGDAWIGVSSLVGPYSDALDLARALRVVSDALHVRVALAKMGPQAQEFVLVETLVRRRRLDPVTLSNHVMTIGVFADRLEDMFFGSDQR